MPTWPGVRFNNGDFTRRLTTKDDRTACGYFHIRLKAFYV